MNTIGKRRIRSSIIVLEIEIIKILVHFLKRNKMESQINALST